MMTAHMAGFEFDGELDSVQTFIYARFWEIRGCTPGEDPIHIGVLDGEDSLFSRHIRTLDRQYMEAVAIHQKQEMDRVREQSKAKKATPRSAGIRRR